MIQCLCFANFYHNFLDFITLGIENQQGNTVAPPHFLRGYNFFIPKSIFTKKIHQVCIMFKMNNYHKITICQRKITSFEKGGNDR